MGDVITDPFRAARLILTLRRVGVTDPNVLRVMEEIPRDAFVTEDASDLAFEDAVLPIPCGQAILRPSVIGQLIQMADLGSEPTARVLLVGLGSGYSAALLARLAADVFAIERYKRLFDLAAARLAAMQFSNIHARQGDGLQGWTERGPFDRIVLTGTAEEGPVALLQQLTKEGRLIQPVSTENGQRLKLIDPAGNILKSQKITGFQPLTEGVAHEL